MSEKSARTESDGAAVMDGLVQLSFAVQAVLTRAAQQAELTVPQLRVMGILRDREPGMLELAQHLGLDKSSVTGLIDRAERRGLVERVPSNLDGRVVTVRTTPLGRELSTRVESVISTEISRLTSILPSHDRHTLAALIDRVLAERPTYDESPAPASP